MSAAKKVLLVTGGGRGIGAATSRLAAKAGYRVAINYASNEAAAAALVQAIEQAGGEALAIKGDVGSEAEIQAMFERIDHVFGPLDALVNNAGVVDQRARVEEMSGARLERMMRINVIGSMLCAREAVKRMSTSHGGNGGAIVNVSSIAARIGGPGEYVDYAASKGAIDSFTIGLAREVAGEGIRVNAVSPGIVDTEIHASGGQPDRVERMRHGVPMKGRGPPKRSPRQFSGSCRTGRPIRQARIWKWAAAANPSQG